jgi:L-ascorbate metabolism protein UlaG (beta-lactamase superfamily)
MAIPADEDWRRRVIERGKELDHEHRRRVPKSWAWLLGRVARLGLLRAIAKGWLLPPRSGEVRHVPRPEAGRVAVTFVGHATILLSTPTTRIVVDPYLPETLLGMRRRELACLHPRDMQDVGVVLVTHAHPDRLHRESLRSFAQGATLLVPPKAGDLARDVGFESVRELPPGDTWSAPGLEITAVAARHDGRRGVWDRAWRGSVGYIVKTQGATLYLAGDTAYFSGFEEIGRRLHPDLAILPIGGYRPFEQRSLHMSPLDAAQAFHDLGAQLFLPVAYGSFPMGYEDLDEPLRWMTQVAQEHGFRDRLVILRPGETFQVIGKAAPG